MTGISWIPATYFSCKIQNKTTAISGFSVRIKLYLAFIIIIGSLIGSTFTYLQGVTNFWGIPWLQKGNYFSDIGFSIIIMILCTSYHETSYSIKEWKKAFIENEELKKANVQTQLDALKIQIQPHFLFNSLNTLLGITEANDKEKAKKFIEELSYVYRYLLQANDQNLISLREEVGFLYSYIFLLKTRFNNGLHFQINLPSDYSEYLIPPLTLQILVENAVKHNIVSRARPLHVNISIDESKKEIVVQNNIQKRENIQSTGKGLNNLKKKFQLLHMPDLSIFENNQQFIIKLPLIEVHEYIDVES